MSEKQEPKNCLTPTEQEALTRAKELLQEGRELRKAVHEGRYTITSTPQQSEISIIHK